MRVIEVVAAVINRENGQILACRRAPGRTSAGLWEFPGGKVERSEDPREALIREIREELDTKIRIGLLVTRTTTRVGELQIDLACYRVEFDGVEPKESADHDELQWMFPSDLHHLDWALPDLPAVQLLAEDQPRP
ncbi:DNA mismatch repair protein MutT [Curtobacterium sp. MMLR14_010]|uniref:(deoxy)nucleoside triphosphate pyrophosphohydrolase n=1 Tax=Curtobacterium sp. MMLR14_010 TaxID=1898743 RepID=UPI0008DE781C|nr:(deoxy)nucleoside triphosphate pyrophosphohydrolase [Curtobacterium sp. MMLR14_010]OII35220.1 DNA mismatch repair protein MutT [Curtobacterium sp. MMLR14_010]